MTTLLTSLPYFHGTIDTRECREMLPDLGDFLIRNPCNEMDKAGSTCVCILTTAVSPDQASDNSKLLPLDYSLRLECTTRLKSYGIMMQAGFYCIQGTTDTFPSVEALCNSYLQSRQPFPMGGMALRPVARRPWQLLLSDIEFPNPEIALGSGEYGKVIKGKILRHGIPPTDVALKCSTGDYTDMIAEMFTEARTMRALQHPNIIGLQGVVIEKPPIYLVIEFLEGSSLLDALQKKRVSNVVRFPICVAILYGVLWMHTHKYIHRDIAARNVMVSHDCRTVKLIDFGLAKHSLQIALSSSDKIPVKRLAPEALRTRIFSSKSDTWALAICFWEVFHDGAEIYSNVVASVNSKPPTAAVTPVVTPSTSKDKKSATQTRKRAKKVEKPNPEKPVAREYPEMPELVITKNEEYLPKEFVPKFKLMTEKKARKRIELAAMANFVEKEVFPTLPAMVQAELKIHMDRRPLFDPNFKVDFVNNNSVVTQPTAASVPANLATPTGAVTPTSTPAGGGTPAKLKTVTRRRKPTASKGKSDHAQSSGKDKKSTPDAKQKTSRRKGK